MKISDIINLAIAGELKQLSVKDNISDIIGFINLGILELYKRFQPNTEEAIITMSSTQTLYKLEEGATNVSMVGPKDSVMYIIGLYEEDGTNITDKLNKNDDPLGIFTPSYGTIQIMAPTDGGYISVIYVQNPIYKKEGQEPQYGLLSIPLIADQIDYTGWEVDLPLQLLEPLLHYIGYRGHGSVNGSLTTENNTHYTRFEASCKRIRDLGVLTQDSLSSYEKTGGWV